MLEKKCIKCGECKELEKFYRNKNQQFGRSNYCKTCQDILTKPYAKRYKEYQAEYGKVYKMVNKEKLQEYNKAYMKFYNKNKKTA